MNVAKRCRGSATSLAVIVVFNADASAGSVARSPLWVRSGHKAKLSACRLRARSRHNPAGDTVGGFSSYSARNNTSVRDARALLTFGKHLSGNVALSALHTDSLLELKRPQDESLGAASLNFVP